MAPRRGPAMLARLWAVDSRWKHVCVHCLCAPGGSVRSVDDNTGALSTRLGLRLTFTSALSRGRLVHSPFQRSIVYLPAHPCAPARGHLPRRSLLQRAGGHLAVATEHANGFVAVLLFLCSVQRGVWDILGLPDWGPSGQGARHLRPLAAEGASKRFAPRRHNVVPVPPCHPLAPVLVQPLHAHVSPTPTGRTWPLWEHS